MKMIVLLAVLSTVLYTSSAHANEFDIVAAGCIPDGTPLFNKGSTMASGNWTIANGTLGWASTANETGGLQFACGIQVTITATSHLWIHTNTPSGTSICVTYAKYTKNTGGSDGWGTGVVTTCSSDTIVSISDTYDPTTYIYLLEVSIDRGATNQFPVFYYATVW
jgi:hypothetical protein